MSYKDNHKRTELQIDVERDITPGLSAVDRAIAFVRTRGTATSAELHMVMDLPAEAHPSWHLEEQIERGMLVRNGKHWTLGAAALEEGGLIDVLEVEAA